MVTLTIVKRSSSNSATGAEAKKSRFPLELSFPSTITGVTLWEVKKEIEKKTKLNIFRQRLTVAGSSPSDKPVALTSDEKSLEALGVKDGSEITLKDLGPQIAWKTVFLIEYFGPLFIHPFFYLYQQEVYGKNFEHSKMQQIALAMFLFHYSKRELETLFVHKFSLATMPLFNVFKNSFHYWFLSGFLIAPFLYSPSYGAKQLQYTFFNEDWYLYLATAIFIFGELSNFKTHLTLSALRPGTASTNGPPNPGAAVRKLPKGYGFNLVSCPNYFFEAVSWLGVLILTGHWAVAIFFAVSVGQMAVWAVKKHKRYSKEFGRDAVKGKKAMIPFIL